MPRFAASLTTMFTEWPLSDRFAAARDAGFAAVELQNPYSLSPDTIATRLAQTGLELVLINAPAGSASGDRGLAALPSRSDDFTASIDIALSYVEATGVARVHVLSGTGDTCSSTTWDRSIRQAAERFARCGTSVLIEPLNTRDNPRYHLADFHQAAAAIRRLALPNLALQYDVYHRQIMHGDITTSLHDLLPITGHVQIAGVPGRHEPDNCEIDYAFVLAELDRLGYSGWVGCEYRPRHGTLQGLGWLAKWHQIRDRTMS